MAPRERERGRRGAAGGDRSVSSLAGGTGKGSRGRGGPGKDSIIKTAEQALSYIKEVESDNLFVTLHLCHELKAGNGDRLDEIAAKIKPWLRLASINGAENDAAEELDGWARTLMPLTEGAYDSSKLLNALKSIDYKGPVLLHTGGGLGKRAPADHHQTSYKRFQEMVDTLD